MPISNFLRNYRLSQFWNERLGHTAHVLPNILMKILSDALEPFPMQTASGDSKCSDLFYQHLRVHSSFCKQSLRGEVYFLICFGGYIILLNCYKEDQQLKSNIIEQNKNILKQPIKGIKKSKRFLFLLKTKLFSFVHYYILSTQFYYINRHLNLEILFSARWFVTNIFRIKVHVNFYNTVKISSDFFIYFCQFV